MRSVSMRALLSPSGDKGAFQLPLGPNSFSGVTEQAELSR